MTDYGNKIAELRNANKMTQAQLGEQLNVTSQAVSKWENGLSEPDIESIRKLCEIFHITFDEFFGAGPKQEETVQTVSTQAPVVLAYCDTCDKPLYNPKEYQVTIENGVQHTTCLDCIPVKAASKQKQREAQLANERKQRRLQQEAERKQRQQNEWATVRKGLLWGILGGLALGAIMLIGSISEGDTVFCIVDTIFGVYGGYALTAQLIWQNSVADVFGFFFRSLKLPGVIFTLDLDGILFLIFVKVGGAILSAIFSVLMFIIGFFVAWAYSMIIFPFALVHQIREVKSTY